MKSEFKELLARAYMNLFDALVDVYMASNLSQGQSLYFATGIMRTILSDLPRSPASEYLIALFNTHKATVAKKSMLMPDAPATLDGMVVMPNKVRKVEATLSNLAAEIDKVDMLMLVQNFKMPELPPLPEIVIQNEPRKNKPVYHPQVKQMISAPAAFIKNYNLRNARRRNR